jgi:hypothetical protein
MKVGSKKGYQLVAGFPLPLTLPYCRPVLPLDAPTGFLEHLEDVVLFQSSEGFDDLASNKTVPIIMKSAPYIYSIHEQGNYATASFSPLPALNLGALTALICIGSPV